MLRCGTQLQGVDDSGIGRKSETDLIQKSLSPDGYAECRGVHVACGPVAATIVAIRRAQTRRRWPEVSSSVMWCFR